jgi:peroxiredoxin
MSSRQCWISAASSLADEWPPEPWGLRCPGCFDPPTLLKLNLLRLKELQGGLFVSVRTKSADQMKPRFLILLVLLTAVVASTAWRLQHPHQAAPASARSISARPAPDFQLLDQNNRPVRLQGYVSRHRILIAFFDPRTGPDGDPVLQKLREFYPTLKRAGFVVLAISTPLAPDIKPQILSYPFPVLRDTNAGTPESCCNRWGVSGNLSDQGSPITITPALFLIEQNGLTSWKGEAPEPIADSMAFILGIVRGE